MSRWMPSARVMLAALLALVPLPGGAQTTLEIVVRLHGGGGYVARVDPEGPRLLSSRPVEADELLEMRELQSQGRLEIEIEEDKFLLADHRRFLDEHRAGIDDFRARQQAAFRAERDAWAAAGEFDRDDS